MKHCSRAGGAWLSAAAAVVSFACCAGEVKTELVERGIWRVRMERDGKWPESGLNRYAVLEDLGTPSAASLADISPVAPEMAQVGPGFRIRLPIADGTRVFGLGDCSRDNIQRRPGRYEIHVKNIHSYIPIPVLFTTEGWGVLVNSTWLHTIDVGAEDPGAIVVSAPEGEIDFYVFKGDGMRGLLERYTRLAGRPAMLPIWGYGFTFVANQMIEQFELVNEAHEFRRYSLPCDTIGLEPGWMSKFYDASTRKQWDLHKFYFPYWRPAGAHTFVGALDRIGVKLSLWLCVDYDVFRYEEQCAAGRAKASGKKFEMGGDIPESWEDDRVNTPPGTAKGGVSDGRFAPRRTKADEFREGDMPWFEHLKPFVDQGARAFKLDGSAQVAPYAGKPGRKWANGMKEEEAHNLYTVIYDKQMAKGYEDYTGRRAMVYSAGGYAGVQRYVATWAGDTGGGVRPLVSVLNLGMSGHPNQSCDMFTRDTGRFLASQGLHFGFLAPWAQQNNWDYWDLPWIDKPARVAAFRAYDELRYRLVPYIYAAAAEASRTGWPIARALPLVHPGIAEYDSATNTYMLGDSLLVGVFSRDVVIPPGKWHDWRTGATVEGPRVAPVEITPEWGGALYVKAGAVIPTWPVKQHLETGWNDEVVLEVWPSADGAAELYEDDGVSLGYRGGKFATTPITLHDGVLTIGRREGSFDGMPATRRFRVRVHDGAAVREMDAGRVGGEGGEIRVAPAAASAGVAKSGVLPEGAFSSRDAKSAAPDVRTVTVRPASMLGPIKPLNGVNNAPIRPRAYQSSSNFKAYKAARIPSARPHDAVFCSGYGGPHVADISGIFPDFDKDEDDPASYDFIYTDRLLETIRMAGAEVFYRLGQSIEHGVKKYHNGPPKDYAKWARVCEHVIRHYNEGWADGFRWNIRHWEIWNEASNNSPKNPTCWGGTTEQFYDFYEVVARHLKKCFPDLMIGGPATTGWEEWSEKFLVEMGRRKVPMDFFSWHCYMTKPEEVAARAVRMRGYMDANGYGAAKSYMTEWNYVRDWGPEWGYSLSVESGERRVKGAAYTAAVLAECQNAPVDMAHYYDARPGTAMNGLFQSSRPIAGYYAIYSWGKLAALGTQVGVENVRSADGDEKDDVYAVAAADGKGRFGLCLTRYDDDDNAVRTKRVRVRVDGVPLGGLFAHVVDSRRFFTEEPLDAEDDGSALLELEPNCIVYICN